MFTVSVLFTCLTCLMQFISYGSGCGTVTHMLISGRAREFYDANDKYNNYRQLLDKHRDALQAGSGYPDSFYGPTCFGDKFHNVSEDTHWTPFLNASVNYIRRTYPQPWEMETEKLVVFLFGIVSHQTADILWHSLGIAQGFLTTMGDINFHGDYTSAHHFGDLGGEFVSLIDLDADLVVDLKQKWYIPSKDLFNIYREFYGTTKITLSDIETCSSWILLEGVGEALAKSEIYSGVVDRSPFLVEEMENYFVGGVNDMVGWTQRSWNNVVTMLNKGTDVCNLPYNPLFVTCNKSSTFLKYNHEEKIRNGYYVNRGKHGITQEDFNITKTARGIIIELGQKLKNEIQWKYKEISKLKRKLFRERKIESEKKKPNIPTRKLLVNGSYARFGWSISSGDIDKDGYTDVVIGSPGYSHVNNWQTGRIYIVHGSESRTDLFNNEAINLDDHKLEQLNVSFIEGADKKQSRFGTSVTVLDINLDGVHDIVVSSPSYWNDSPLDYNGLVSVYLGQLNKRQYSKPDVVITCKVKYCNLGYSLNKADVNNDGFPDLLIGSPYYTAGYEQSGIIAVLMASKNIKAKSVYEFEKLQTKLLPEKQQPYAWFGHSITSKGNTVMVSSPNYRKFFLSNCSYSQNDIQVIGQSHIFSFDKKQPNLTLTGSSVYQSTGYSVDIGFPYDKENLVLAYSIPGNDVDGRFNYFTEDIYRAGSVILVNYTSKDGNILAQFDGNRKYARFGQDVKFCDLNSDGFDDLIISEPNRIKDRSEWQYIKNGRIYVFYGGSQMPSGKATFSPSCDLEQPCPFNVANFTSDSLNEQSNNGHFVYNVSDKHGVYLYSADVASDAGFYHHGAGRRSGVVWRYYFKH
ncbi:phosphatidylinositol-glycan-specific phospholipase D-like [Mytilus trossulus]|uniref:phosphatidylinositol-glycan-specific phospholipase D-like n=1 Tax=Mytilus trossulus TaxID=6551 RepID=UPI0030061E4A